MSLIGAWFRYRNYYSINANANNDIEEIIVTASKKEENIQDVPMSVQAAVQLSLIKRILRP